jgi:hypothetical protein
MKEFERGERSALRMRQESATFCITKNRGPRGSVPSCQLRLFFSRNGNPSSLRWVPLSLWRTPLSFDVNVALGIAIATLMETCSR